MHTDISLDATHLAGRSFLLGNTRAFSLHLPVAAGISDTLLHPHKWFGAYLYGRKFLEGQLVRAGGGRHILGRRTQSGFVQSLVAARRDHTVEGEPCTEQYLLADGIDGFASVMSGEVGFTVEPEFDIRLHRAMARGIDGYGLEPWEDGCVVSQTLPAGRFDDLTETFLADETAQGTPLFAAVLVAGVGARGELLPPRERMRRKVFTHDRHRRRFVERSDHEERSGDHAPLWGHDSTVVFAPMRLHLPHGGTVCYGFGQSREEAVRAATALRDTLPARQHGRQERVEAALAHARLSTGASRVDAAYAHVLARLMDALVVRDATAEGTALTGPATMILAGNRYFHDCWKRDENIALGFLLSLGFHDLARDVVRDTWQLQDERTGRLPQRIRPGEEPAYHSSDGTLWALWRLHEYWRCTGDDALLREKLPMVRAFFERSLERALHGLLPSGRTEDPGYLWETWMDTPHTPRHGFPVEIQMLWLASLRAFRPIIQPEQPELEAAMRWAEARAWNALQRFIVRGMPADGLHEDGSVHDLITPNPYFCFEVGLDLGPEIEWTMRHVGRRQLAGTHGIVTLAPDDWSRVFPQEFLADRRHVRGRRMRSVGKFNYHRGVEWNWLVQFFVEAELKYAAPDVAFRTYLRPQLRSVLERGGLGGISELFDLSGSRGPEYQTWSMAGFLEALHSFAGVRIDVPRRHIRIAPQLPREFPHLDVRKWYGRFPFDLRYEKRDGGGVLEIDFPEGVPEAEIEIGIVVPRRQAPAGLPVQLDGEPHVVGTRREAIPGTARVRVWVTVPARRTIAVTVARGRSGSRRERCTA